MILLSRASWRKDTIPISQLCLPEWPWVRQSAVFSGIPITEGLFEERCRAVWVVNIEPIRVVAFVKFEDARAIKRGAIHLDSPIPKVGLEPKRVLPHRILSPVGLPFRHFGTDFSAMELRHL